MSTVVLMFQDLMAHTDEAEEDFSSLQTAYQAISVRLTISFVLMYV